jgi:hypothetical protein
MRVDVKIREVSFQSERFCRRAETLGVASVSLPSGWKETTKKAADVSLSGEIPNVGDDVAAACVAIEVNIRGQGQGQGIRGTGAECRETQYADYEGDQLASGCCHWRRYVLAVRPDHLC